MGIEREMICVRSFFTLGGAGAGGAGGAGTRLDQDAHPALIRPPSGSMQNQVRQPQIYFLFFCCYCTMILVAMANVSWL